MSYTEVFGGNTLYPSDVSYLALDLDANITLEWALEASTTSNIVARIIDVTPDAAGRSITMPPAEETGVGQVVQFKNVGPDDFDVLDNAGGALLTIADGEIWTLYLTDNSDAAGTWESFQAGSVTSQAQASALAGYGITAISGTLAQSQQVNTFNADYTAGAADRSSTYVWTGGLGTLTLPSASSVGNNWFMAIRNEGSGNLTISCGGADTINGTGTLVLRPGDSATINTDGTSFYTVGLGQDPVFAFDFTVIDLTGVGATYTLSGAELNRIAYQFIGVLSNNVRVNAPPTTQQYWIANDTTGGSYTVSIATASQSVPLAVPRGSRGIYYCQGTEVVKADTASIATPISVADGGTGATTPSGARINLGGTTVGIAVFTAASEAAGRTALGAGATGSTLFTAANAAAGRSTLSAAASGANSDITSLSALSTPLSVVQGGSGQSSFTNGQLLIGNTTGNTLTKATLTAGTGITITNGTGSITIDATNGGTVTSVDGSGGTTGLTLTGGPITATGTLTLGGTLVVANGGTGATTLTGVLKGNGTSAFSAATAGTDFVAPGTATNFTAKQTFTGGTGTLAAKLVNALETVTISATAATGTIAYDITTQSVLYYTSNAAANWTVNLRGNGSTSLDSLMATGESVTVVFMVTQGGTAYYNSAVQVDGTTSGVTTKWIGGAPSAGTASGIDLYSYVVIKTGSATFTVIASVSAAT